MDTLIGAVIFIVLVVFSLAKKVQESRKKSDLSREQEPVERANLPDSTRRILHGERGVREAKPRTPPGQRQQAPRQGKLLAPGKLLLESLLGVSSEDEGEGDWVPVQESAPRQQVPGRVAGARQIPDTVRPPAPDAAPRQAPQQAPRQTPQQAPRQAPPPAPRRQSAAPERQEQRPRRTRPKAAPTRRRPAAVQAALRRAAQPSFRHRTIFGDIREVRKAIVFAEILGPPRAFTEFEGGPQGLG